MTGKLLFLGFDESRTRLIGAIRERGWDVAHAAAPVEDLSAYGLTVCFGLEGSLSEAALASAPRPPLAVHLSYLPYNRGAHPNFWSFYDSTPSGVTIHEVDAGEQTGPICFQRYVNFAPEETTFAKTEARLVAEAEALFLEHLDAILEGGYVARPQRGAGTYHREDELPPQMTDPSAEIAATLDRLDAEYVDRLKRDIDIVDQVEAVRRRNNVNWMDLLRIALTHAPDDTKAVMRRINTDDNRISELFKKLGEQ